MGKIVLIVHDVRSAHNVGSLLRTAEGSGVEKVYLSGYTPYPEAPGDKRLPHVRRRSSAQINKTALGAENSLRWAHAEDIFKLLRELKKQGFTLLALEQAAGSFKLPDYSPPKAVALVVGNEVKGLDDKVLGAVDACLEIPMLGKKESHNVASATAMALYHLKFHT